MIEQLSLFGERDTLSLVLEWLVEMYEWHKSQWLHWEGHPNFDKWLLDCFSSYQGGTSSGVISEFGWGMYNMSPRGVELIDFSGSEMRMEQIPKAKILKAFGIKDDRKDLLKGETDD